MSTTAGVHDAASRSAQPPSGPATRRPDVPALQAAIEHDGIAGVPGAFPADWADRLHADFEVCFADAMSRPAGTIPRGPQRHYFAVHPERVRGFVDLVTHPVVTGLCEAMLGQDYEIVELAFDVPLPGALYQPWHRDFATPPETVESGRLSSLAFNLTTVDVTPELAPFEVAPGTHHDDGRGFAHGMFPPAEASGRYDALGSRRFPRRGDMSARTGLTLHRGTANRGDRTRPVLILGAVEPAVQTEVHQLVLTRSFAAQLPEQVRRHLRCTVVERLTPLEQKHDIEGLVMG